MSSAILLDFICYASYFSVSAEVLYIVDLFLPALCACMNVSLLTPKITEIYYQTEIALKRQMMTAATSSHLK